MYNNNHHVCSFFELLIAGGPTTLTHSAIQCERCVCVCVCVVCQHASESKLECTSFHLHTMCIGLMKLDFTDSSFSYCSIFLFGFRYLSFYFPSLLFRSVLPPVCLSSVKDTLVCRVLYSCCCRCCWFSSEPTRSTPSFVPLEQLSSI